MQASVTGPNIGGESEAVVDWERMEVEGEGSLEEIKVTGRSEVWGFNEMKLFREILRNVEDVNDIFSGLENYRVSAGCLRGYGEFEPQASLHKL